MSSKEAPAPSLGTVAGIVLLVNNMIGPGDDGAGGLLGWLPHPLAKREGSHGDRADIKSLHAEHGRR